MLGGTPFVNLVQTAASLSGTISGQDHDGSTFICQECDVGTYQVAEFSAHG